MKKSFALAWISVTLVWIFSIGIIVLFLLLSGCALSEPGYIELVGVESIKGDPGEPGSAAPTVYVKVILNSTDLTVDDLAYFTIPVLLNGMDLVLIEASVYTASSSGLPTFTVYNFTDSVMMLSTDLTIDVGELTSHTATTPAVIDTENDDVVTADQIRIDCSVGGTGTKGWDMILTFEEPE